MFGRVKKWKLLKHEHSIHYAPEHIFQIWSIPLKVQVFGASTFERIVLSLSRTYMNIILSSITSRQRDTQRVRSTSCVSSWRRVIERNMIWMVITKNILNEMMSSREEQRVRSTSCPSSENESSNEIYFELFVRDNATRSVQTLRIQICVL